MTNKTALVLGATGLVGGELLTLLLQDGRYQQINCVVRSALTLEPAHAQKVSQYLCAMDQVCEPFADVSQAFEVDHVYVCLGTTIKQAGSKDAFRRVDFDLVYAAAQLASRCQVSSFVWVSSVGADAGSSSFYLRVKGELEDAIYQIEGLNSVAVRPSLLLGEREETRVSEQLGIVVGKILAPIMRGTLAKYRPVHAQEVAKQMISLQRF